MTNDSIYNFLDLEKYRDHTLLIVNTASKCGFTPQLAELEELYQHYKDKNFVILGFPCNQFGSQEPLEGAAIGDFCVKNYGVTFPILDKIDVNGDNAHPLFKYLRSALPGLLGSTQIKWNFTKFLIDKQGNPVERYAPQTSPLSLKDDIEKIL